MSKTNGICVIHTNSVEEVERLAKEGWEPVECSLGSKSVVGHLKMDHHNEYSNLEGVAIRAYRDHFGAGKALQGYIVTGAADADATFAIASLAGILPHPSREPEFEKAPEWMKKAMTRDLAKLAELVNLIDTDPIANKIKLPETEEGKLLLTWGAMCSGVEDCTAFHAGVDRWRVLTGSRPPAILINAAAEEEAQRIKASRDIGRSERLGVVSALEGKVWGFDVWYAEISPIIVALTPDGNITIGCVNEQRAEKLLGVGGLKNVFPKLKQSGWGGREAVGGSPRGMRMTWEQAVETAKIIASLVFKAE